MRIIPTLNVLIAWSIGRKGSFVVIVALAWFLQHWHENWIGKDSTLVMVDLKRNENTIKQNYAWEKRTRTNSKLFSSVFQGCETYCNSQMTIGWNEVLQARRRHCARRPLIRCYLTRTTKIRKRMWELWWNSQGLEGPFNSWTDYPEAVRTFREINREAAEVGYEINPTVGPDLQVRQRPGEFQQHRSSNSSCCYRTAWSVDPKTGSTSSSTTCLSSAEWQE